MAIEGAEAEAEEVYPEQPQESEVAEEDQELGTDFTDCYNTQGKHRFILAQYHTSVESLIFILIYALSL